MFPSLGSMTPEWAKPRGCRKENGSDGLSIGGPAEPFLLHTAGTVRYLRAMRRIIGAAILIFGLFVAIWPFASAWQVTSQVRALTPQNENLVEQNTALFPLLDGDFIFGTALYEGTTNAEVTSQLIQAGFNERWFSQANGSWQGIECCGEYDAALARVTDLDNGQVLVEFSAADSDGQGIWPFFLLFGLGVAFIGWVIMCLPKKPMLPFEEPSEPELVA